MASRSASAILAFCSVTQTNPAVGAIPATTTTYNFKASSIYASTGVTAATGVSNIPSTDWKGTEPLITVGQMVASGKLERLYATVEPSDTTKPNKQIAILCESSKSATARGNDAVTGLIGKTLTTKRGGTVTTLGKVVRVGNRISDHFA